MGSLYDEALTAFRVGKTTEARQLSELALERARADRSAAAEVDALCMLARVALREGKFERVAATAEEAAVVARNAGESKLQRMPLHMQAAAARMLHDYASARRLYLESIHLNTSLGDERMVTAELRNLAYVELHDGQRERATELFGRAKAGARRLHFDALTPYLISDAAAVAYADGDPERAARLLGAAQSAFSAAQQVPNPDDAAELDWLNAKLANALGDDRFRAARASGASLGPEDVLGG